MISLNNIKLMRGTLTLLDEVNLVLMGADMGLGEELDKRARSSKVKMHRLGHVEDDVYRSALSSASILVLPSEYEAFGIVLLEAAAAATPVIGTRVGGVPEAMSDEGNGFLVDYNDPVMLGKKITLLLEDENLCQELGDHGRVFSRQFSWSSIVDQLELEYLSLL